MAIADLYFNFSDAQAIPDGTAVISTNVYDAGSAKKVFEGGAADLKCVVTATGVGGTSPTLTVSLIAADNAALTSNPITLAATGALTADAAGRITTTLSPSNQATAKRYYGLSYDMAGTDPVATVNAELTIGLGQTNLVA